MLCRNSPDGQHSPGPPSACGNLFCVHCGEHLYRLVPPPKDPLLNIAVAVTLIVWIIVGVILVCIAG
jgi:hypothetical protein